MQGTSCKNSWRTKPHVHKKAACVACYKIVHSQPATQEEPQTVPIKLGKKITLYPSTLVLTLENAEAVQNE